MGHEYGWLSKEKVLNRKSNGNFPKAEDWDQGLGNPSHPFDLLNKIITDGMKNITEEILSHLPGRP